MSGDVLLEKLSQAMSDLDSDAVSRLVKEAVEAGVNPIDVIEKGLTKGVRAVGDRFARGEYFLIDLMCAAGAMKDAMEFLEPYIQGVERKKVGTVVLGTVQGDLHDVGKNIVAAMLRASGFDVIDLGVDVPKDVFVEKVRKIKPDILGMSVLIGISVPEQKNVIEELKKAGLRETVKVMVGGAPVTEKWAKDIGADAYASDAQDAVEKALKLVGRR